MQFGFRIEAPLREGELQLAGFDRFTDRCVPRFHEDLLVFGGCFDVDLEIAHLLIEARRQRRVLAGYKFDVFSWNLAHF